MTTTVLVLAACLLPSGQGPGPERLLEVWAEPGFTRIETAMQIRHYPLLIVQNDGTVIASSHGLGGSGPGVFRVREGRIPKPQVQELRARLARLLPPEPAAADEPVVVDAGRVTITARSEGATIERSLASLEPSFEEVLALPELEGAARASVVQRLAFARLVESLRQTWATRPHVPEALDVLVTALGDGQDRATAAEPWPLPSVPLEAWAEHEGAGAREPRRVDAAEVVGPLARQVVSGRVYRQDGRLWRVLWWPRLR